MRNERRSIVKAAWMVAALALVWAGCQSQSQQEASSSPPPPPQVVAATVQPRSIMLTTELPGRTTSHRVAEIRPQVNGLIQKRLFTEGADVNAGDVLYQIDPASFQAALSNAEAALVRSEANLPAIRSRVSRYDELLAEKAISQQDYDDAAAQLKQAEADIQYWKAAMETARINLAYTRITAPISGRIGRSNVTEGAIVTAYQPLAMATIQQLDPIYVDVPQSISALLKIKRSRQEGRLEPKTDALRKVELHLENDAVYPFEGTLQFQDVTVETSTGSVILRIVFPNPEHFLLPGMFVRAVLKEGVREDAILIPQQAVSRDTKGNPVALVVDGDDRARQRMLSLDRAIDDQWLVNDGLDAGDRVIVEGLQKVRPGMAVRVALQTAAGAAGESADGSRASTASPSN
ncbi:MAG TPA: efflux RND transporter periplasmic adaptor subunit [Desulfosarcina sp.]|nr:efflux RND transporter periplasmic adaptor subunit [Desulfosarcina sp.]